MSRTIAVIALPLVLALTATSAWADFKRERTLTLEPGGVFTLESDIGNVVLTGGSAAGARVLITSDRDLESDYEFTFDESARAATDRNERARSVST